jgi:hypothetical protein
MVKKKRRCTMCNEAERIKQFIPYWQGRSVIELFPDYVMARFPYDTVIPGHCLICKRPLRDHDMWPPYRCPRCMCEVCYQRDIVGRINDTCIISGDRLPSWKLDRQRINAREVENNIAEGSARDYYTLMACTIVGVDMRFLRNETRHNQRQHLPHGYREEVLPLPQQPHALPSAHEEVKALPYLPEPVRLQRNLMRSFNDTMRRLSSQGKAVQAMPLKRRRERR